MPLLYYSINCILYMHPIDKYSIYNIYIACYSVMQTMRCLMDIMSMCLQLFNPCSDAVLTRVLICMEMCTRLFIAVYILYIHFYMDVRFNLHKSSEKVRQIQNWDLFTNT